MNKRKTLTVFTPTYNRIKTIKRTYKSLCEQTNTDVDWLIIDDGSFDGCRNWVFSLGEIVDRDGTVFDWMGRPLCEKSENHFVVQAGFLRIEYIYKPNGGLYTGYNVAFSVIQSELCVCIDSDDYLPSNAVEIITKKWQELSVNQRQQIGGIAGLDYNVVDKSPIGGVFKIKSPIAFVQDMGHIGDCKFVFRTDAIRRFAPQIGFEGEKDFNPHFMQMQLFDEYPMLVINENLCWVEYQYGNDSMSQAIFKQYLRSPKSFAKYRLQELALKRGNSFLKKIRLSAHYVSSCIFSKDRDWLKNSNSRILTIISIPFGAFLCLYIKAKAISQY